MYRWNQRNLPSNAEHPGQSVVLQTDRVVLAEYGGINAATDRWHELKNSPRRAGRPLRSTAQSFEHQLGTVRCHLNYAQIHFASVAAFVAGWRSS